MSEIFDRKFLMQVRFLLEILPIVMRSPRFALKGGTAINLFVRDLPRLSVDIDLAYLPVTARAEAIADINDILSDTAAFLKKTIPKSLVHATKPFNSGKEIKLLVEFDGSIIKIEPNYTIRGCVFPPSERKLSKECAEHFGVSIISNVVSFEDLYAGKICAALDRQHPRDLFDIHILLDNEGITEGIRQAFLVYLMSHNRPMVELLDPNWHSLTSTYTSEFLGMSAKKLKIDELQDAGKRLVQIILEKLTDAERRFLISFKRGKPDWNKFFLPEAKNFPGVLWKQKNLEKVPFEKMKRASQKLEMLLG